MTDEEIRIKVAESCGWKRIPAEYAGAAARLFYGDAWWRDAENNTIACADQLPNYPLDLNACAEFEKALTDEEHLRYRVQLWNVVITEGDETTWDRQFISATARQRCIAYLKTKGITP